MRGDPSCLWDRHPCLSFIMIHEKSTPWGASVSVLELVDQLLMIGLDDVKTLLNVLDQFSDFPLVDCPPSLNVLDVTIWRNESSR